MTDIVFCDACGLQFSEDEWINAHAPHKPGCISEDCFCDFVVHSYCCPECEEGNT